MGGHGGLNILPQKSWHVWNRDARSKVERDEAKAQKEEEEAAQRHADQEREFRRQLLLQRAGRAQGGEGTSGRDAAAGGDAGIVPAREAAAAAAAGPVAPQAADQHINFWQEDEARAMAQHPEVLAEKRAEAERRGKADFYTTDAKFDEKFKLGYGLNESKPWYATAPAPSTSGQAARVALPGALTALPSAQQAAVPVGGAETQTLPLQPDLAANNGMKKHSKRSRQPSSNTSSSSSRDSSSSSGSSSDSDSSTFSGAHRHKRRRRRYSEGRSASRAKKGHRRNGDKEDRRQSRKGRRKHKSKSGSKRRKDGGGAGGSGPKTLEQLRAERVEREQQERDRERQLLMGMQPAMEPAGYNSAFGHGAALAKRKGRSAA